MQIPPPSCIHRTTLGSCVAQGESTLWSRASQTWGEEPAVCDTGRKQDDYLCPVLSQYSRASRRSLDGTEELNL